MGSFSPNAHRYVLRCLPDKGCSETWKYTDLVAWFSCKEDCPGVRRLSRGTFGRSRGCLRGSRYGFLVYMGVCVFNDRFLVIFNPWRWVLVTNQGTLVPGARTRGCFCFGATCRLGHVIKNHERRCVRFGGFRTRNQVLYGFYDGEQGFRPLRLSNCSHEVIIGHCSTH